MFPTLKNKMSNFQSHNTWNLANSLSRRQIAAVEEDNIVSFSATGRMVPGPVPHHSVVEYTIQHYCV